jgi:transcriptional regulator with XRE-family HTH domain
MEPSSSDGRRQAAEPRLAADLLRSGRERKGLSIRELASRLGVSPSLISQIETGKVTPSVGSLVAIATELELSLDELFADPETGAIGPGARRESPVLRGSERLSIQLATGVRWHRLTPRHEEDVDFLYAVYEVGGASCPPDAMMSHRGREYGLVLSGRLGATVGAETHELEADDSIVFDSRVPHRFWTIGEEPAYVVWAITTPED